MVRTEREQLLIEISNVMHKFNRFNSMQSGFHFYNEVLFVQLNDGTLESFLYELCDAHRKELKESRVALVLFDGLSGTVKQILKIMATALYEQNPDLTLIYICEDFSEAFWIDEDEEKTPPEREYETLKNEVNTFILAKLHSQPLSIIELLLSCDSFRTDDEKEISLATLLAKRFKDIGFAYYHFFYSPEELDALCFAENALIDCIRRFPAYMAKEVLYQIIGGECFKTGMHQDLSDERIIRGILQDHFAADCRLDVSVDIIQRGWPFEMGISLLFSRFDESAFVFTEDGLHVYPRTSDYQLQNRIDRLMDGSSYRNMKELQYEVANVPFPVRVMSDRYYEEGEL